MLRILYLLLLRLHPRRFRERFGAEMQVTFQDARETEGFARLLSDVTLSLLRQSFLRSQSRKQLVERARRSALAGIHPLGDSRQPGLSPLRILEGGAVSLALFVTVFLCVRGGNRWKESALIGRDGSSTRAQPLTPSDLATIHVECSKQSGDGCPPETQNTAGIPDEMSALQPPPAKKQDNHELLLPAGPLGIGRILYKWPQVQANSRGSSLTRLVFVWYPTLRQPSTSKPLASVWDYSRANHLFVQTHTEESPPIVGGTSLLPVLLFYPAMNSSSAAYTTQIENLVSHGYVVASLEPRTDRSVVSFSNSQLLPFAADLRRAYRAGNNASRKVLLQAASRIAVARQKTLAADLSFVLDRLTVMDRASRADAPFEERLDLSRIGAIGHSDGGTAAALACQWDGRISACLSEDGWTPGGPYPHGEAATTPAKPFLWINLPVESPENEQLAYLHMGRPEFRSLVGQSENLANQELTALGSRAHRVTIRLPDVTDSYFTDGPFVWSTLNPPGSETERNVLVIVNLYVRGFFDYYLRGGSSQLLDGSTLPLRNVEVKRYGGAA